jgi:transaldolase
MKIFLDTANIDEIREAASLGVIDGITTNPSLIAKEGRDLKEAAQEIFELVDGPISLEVVATDAAGMVEEGRQLAGLHPNVVVKIPMVREGLKALKVLSGEGIRVNMTLVFQASQALLVAKNGAAFVSPFVGRIDDISGDGMQLIEEILTIYENYDYPTEVLVASVRSVKHIVEAAMMGADICTVPYKVIEQMLKHPLTDNGLKQFLEDYEKSKKGA